MAQTQNAAVGGLEGQFRNAADALEREGRLQHGTVRVREADGKEYTV